MKFAYLIYIGRFQPFHQGHLTLVEQALTQAKKLVILCGSAQQPRSINNPWSVSEREAMIRSALPKDVQERVVVCGISDRMYNDQKWVGDVQDTIHSILNQGTPEVGPIGLVAPPQDEGFLDLFPQWPQLALPEIEPLYSFKLRDRYFNQQDLEVGVVPKSVNDWLDEFKRTASFVELAAEWQFIQNYREAWACAPHPPIFVTTDAVVIQSGHVLLVKRRARPGKGLWALPGGFVEQNETLQAAMLRELREETKLKVPLPVLVGSIKSSRVFDHPNRSVRGRTITHAFLIELAPGDLPKVKGGDDAEKAKWFPLSEFKKMQEQLLEDHFHIVDYFLGQI